MTALLRTATASLGLLGLLGASLLPVASHAQETIDIGTIRNEDVVVVQRLLYPKAGRTAVGLHIGVMPFDAYTITPNAAISFDQHLSEKLAISLIGGVGYGFKTPTYTLLESPTYGVAPYAYRYLGSALLGIEWSPIYAKMNINGARIIHFDTYFSLRGGATLEDSVIPGGGTSIGPTLSPGIGGRLFLGRTGALKIELRDDVPAPVAVPHSRRDQPVCRQAERERHPGVGHHERDQEVIATVLSALLWSAPASAAPSTAEIFAEVVQAASSGNRAEAAQKLVEVVKNPAHASAHGQAWMMLADSFAELQLPLAAVEAWAKAIELDPKATAERVPDALELAETTGEVGRVVMALGDNLAFAADEETRNRAAYLVAREHVRRGNLGPAMAMLMTGSSTHAGFEDIEQLRGIVLSLQGRNEDAIPPFLTAEAAGRRAGRDARFRNRANLNIARAYYTIGDFTNAIVYYAKVDRSSDFWLDAQFERAWAHFRGQDINGALAMLFTHDSPFFEEGYFNAEADLLRAYSLFLMCKFPDATKEINAFEAKWAPIRDAYAAVQMSPREAFIDVAAFVEGRPYQLPVAMLRPFAREDRIKDAVAIVRRADDELQRAAGLGGGVGELAIELTEALRDQRVEMEGQRVLDRIASAEKELGGLLTDIEITRLDLLNFEAQMYERAAVTGELDEGDHIGRVRDYAKRRKGFRVWPFQGEYWADELGWYVFNARPDCPNSLTSGRAQP